jgi:uncharacterized membrane protein YhhN
MTPRVWTRRVVSAVIGACLVGHAFASYRRIPWLRAATRCPLMVLVAGYVASDPRHRLRGVGPLVGGLLCASVGDTVLMRESDRALLAGIAAFLGTHACYLGRLPASRCARRRAAPAAAACRVRGRLPGRRRAAGAAAPRAPAALAGDRLRRRPVHDGLGGGRGGQ